MTGPDPSPEGRSEGVGPDPSDLLSAIRAERGYALSFHEILARTDPRLIDAYRTLYSELTLEKRHLDPRCRELIWTGLLTTAREHVGSLHLERAIRAGATQQELRAAVRLAAVAETWDTLVFAHSNWAELLGSGTQAIAYRQLVESSELADEEAGLVLLVCAAGRMCASQFVDQLVRCYELGLREVEIAEALSFLLWPKGANTLLWATDLWLESFADGTIIPGETLSRVSFDVRRH